LGSSTRFQAGDLSVGTGYINVTVAVAPRAVSLMVDEAPVTSPVLRLKLVSLSGSWVRIPARV
jgi:hypothetical protein